MDLRMSWFRFLAEILFDLGLLYASYARILFAVLSHIAADNFIALRGQLKTLTLSSKTTEQFEQFTQLKFRHLSICRMAQTLNEMFGAVILVDIASIFLGVINHAIHIINNVSDDSIHVFLLAFSVFLYHIVNLIIITCSADNLKTKVSLNIKLITLTNVSNAVTNSGKYTCTFYT